LTLRCWRAIAGLVVVCDSAIGAPAIYPHQVVNAASYYSPGLPAGSIAQGSLFTLFGTGLGPAQGVQQSSFPLMTTFSGVSIQVTQKTNSVSAIPLYVSQGQINALMPSNTPLGWVSVVVTVSGAKTNPSPAYIVHDSPGVFTFTGTGIGPAALQNAVSGASLPLNSNQASAMPGQTEILYLTGLGPISSPDNQAPPANVPTTPVEVWVGGVPASVTYSGRSPCCSGLDQIDFVVPASAPQGCWVPVSVRTSHTTVSNFTSMAISADGSPCSEPTNPLAGPILNGGSLGTLTLTRMTIHEDLGVTAPVDVTSDFVAFNATQHTSSPFAFAPWASLPPAGSCTVYPAIGDVFEGGKVPDETSSYSALDPGTQVQIANSAGSQPATLIASAAPLGSYLPLYSLPNTLYLAAGNYSVRGAGGSNVGAFNASITVPSPLVWSNRDATNTVSRSAALTLHWSGGAPSQMIMILGMDSDLPSNSSAVFLCTAAAGATSLTIPEQVLSAIPSSQPSALRSKSVIYIVATSDAGFVASGLSVARAAAVYMTGKTVRFQ
jgi:uncharacterized protein (TIGR03437 family)